MGHHVNEYVPSYLLYIKPKIIYDIAVKTREKKIYFMRKSFN